MLAWILAAGAVLCLVYYAVIAVYAGIGTSYAFLWVLMGIFFGAAAAGVRHYQLLPERTPLWLPVSLVTLCGAGTVVVLVVQILIFGRVPQTAEPGLDYVIVLGADVKPDRLSSTLQLRLDKAAEYAAENPETVLVLSGAQGSDEPTTEAAAMKAYLLKKGVPERQMLLEERSCSTVENIAYSKLVIEADQAKKEKPAPLKKLPASLASMVPPEEEARIGVLTSNFHLYRACMIAKKQGIEGVYGIASESNRVLFVHFCFRDCLAILKDRLMGNL